MAPTTLTSIVMVAFAVLVLTMSCWAWFGDWEPQPRRTPVVEDPISVEVAALRRAIEAYEAQQRG